MTHLFAALDREGVGEGFHLGEGTCVHQLAKNERIQYMGSLLGSRWLSLMKELW